MNMLNLGSQGLLIVLIVGLLLLTGNKVPELMRGVWLGLSEFRKVISGT